jgi:streptogramin lyase
MFIPAGSGGLQLPLILVFHEVYLYVGDLGTGAIRRYDAKTGAYVDNFVPDYSQGMGAGDVQYFVFGPDKRLYVASFASNRVLRYDGRTGAFIDEFVPGNAGLNQPVGLTFGPDGLLYLGNSGAGEVRRYDVDTGTYEVFIPSEALGATVGITFGPDGNFYAAAIGTSEVLRYDGKTGRLLGALVPPGRGGLTGPRAIEWKVKTTVCHMPGGNPATGKTLSIRYLSARDHLRHGDTLGPCQ